MRRYLVTAERGPAKREQLVADAHEAAVLTTELERDGWRNVRFLGVPESVPCSFCQRGEPCPEDVPAEDGP